MALSNPPKTSTPEDQCQRRRYDDEEDVEGLERHRSKLPEFALEGPQGAVAGLCDER